MRSRIAPELARAGASFSGGGGTDTAFIRLLAQTLSEETRL